MWNKKDMVAAEERKIEARKKAAHEEEQRDRLSQTHPDEKGINK
jgi:hypothetical protein